MPYIKHSKRGKFQNILMDLSRMHLTTGEMNYFITSFLHDQILKNGLCYDMLNSVIGVLECAKLELYRMVAAPYEDKKRLDNGCISELDKIDGRSY